MSDGIAFDNIYVGHEVADAKKLVDEQWKVKHDVELKYEKAEKAKQDEKRKEEDGDTKGEENDEL